jgi:L-asparagine oxygenase
MSSPLTVTLEPHESRSIAEQVATLAGTYRSSDDPRLVEDLAVLADDLPPRIKRAVNRFRLDERAHCMLVRNHVVDQERAGRTPSSWRDKTPACSSLDEEVLLLLYAGLLGEPFGWRTQQNGRLVHEVLPIREDEEAQLGTGSKQLLTWHTEDAFHDDRADYVMLFAIRNPNRAATTLGALDPGALADEHLEVLFQPRFHVAPDHSHLSSNNSENLDHGAFAAIDEMHAKPQRVALLFGAREAPYLRLDPYFTAAVPGDDQARRALEAVVAAIDAGLSDLVAEEGDLLIIDNFRAVHGRRPFTARYDGSDRWLKRVNVARDLRRSRPRRGSATSRLIG